MKPHSVLVGLLLPVLAACASTSTESTIIGAQAFPARPSDHPIDVYTDPAQIPRHYVVVAQLTCTESSGRSGAFWRALSSMTKEDRIDSMKAEARAVGADAIVLGASIVNVTGASGTATTLATSGSSATTSGTVRLATETISAAAAVRYVDEEAAR